MALEQGLKKGDWIIATDKSGVSVTGQANHDMELGGSSLLQIAVGNLSNSGFVNVNVNFWEITVLFQNQILYPKGV